MGVDSLKAMARVRPIRGQDGRTAVVARRRPSPPLAPKSPLLTGPTGFGARRGGAHNAALRGGGSAPAARRLAGILPAVPTRHRAECPRLPREAGSPMSSHPLSAAVGRQVSLPGHFDVPVLLEEARPLGPNGSGGFECRVRLPDGGLEETILSPEEAARLAE